MGLACGTYDLSLRFTSFGIESYYLDLARFINHVHPAQSMTVEAIHPFGSVRVGERRCVSPGHGTIYPIGQIILHGHVYLLFATLTFTVDKEFSLRIGSIYKDRGCLALTPLPSPMRKNVKGRFLRIPTRAIKPSTIFGQSGKIMNTEIRTA